MRTVEDVKKAFHPIPSKEMTEVKKASIQRVEFAFENLVTELLDLVPECADRTAAFRKCLEAKFTAIQAITHTEVKIVDPVRKDNKPVQQGQGQRA